MRRLFALAGCLLIALSTFAETGDAAKPPTVERDAFEKPLDAEWFWGLGTWTAQDGVLHGFESGPRRHGPTKMRHFDFLDGSLQCDFRLLGKATFAGVIFNGGTEGNHLFHVVLGRQMVRLISHPQKGTAVDLVKEAHLLAPDVWHTVKIEVAGQHLTVTLDGQVFSADAPTIGEEKKVFGLDGDSGGPEGEAAGALEFRNLEWTKVR